jgi:hypothetical protein
MKKNSAEFLVFGQALQTSSRYKVYISVGLSAITLLYASFGAFLRLYSLGAHARLPSACAFVRPSRSPPARRGPRAV